MSLMGGQTGSTEERSDTSNAISSCNVASLSVLSFFQVKKPCLPLRALGAREGCAPCSHQRLGPLRSPLDVCPSFPLVLGGSGEGRGEGWPKGELSGGSPSREPTGVNPEEPYVGGVGWGENVPL